MQGVTAVMVAAALLAGAPLVAAETAQPSLAGAWVLNKEDSDDPRARMREGGSMGRGGGGGRGGPRGGMGGRGDMGGGGRGEGRRGPEGGEGRGAMGRRFERLTIEHAGPRLTVVDADGVSDTITTDDKETKHDSERGTVTRRAKWSGSALVVTTEGERGALQERYTLEQKDGAKRLVVTVRREGRMGETTFRRVYDPAVTAPGAGKERSQ